MPPRSIADDVLIDRLTEVFRTVGFSGASLSELAVATGLQKSSLYHRFPGGKAQMANEVLERLGSHVVATAMAPLESGEPIESRIDQVGHRLIEFYDGGVKSCLLDTMSLGGVGPDARAALATAANAWVEAFATVAATSGADPDAALAGAQDAIAAIEGGLVLARATGDVRAFMRAVERLPDTLLGSPRPPRSAAQRKER